jgi:hypothetical protein
MTERSAAKHVCDAATLQPATNTADALFDQGASRLNREMLQAQLEVATRPHATNCASLPE